MFLKDSVSLLNVFLISFLCQRLMDSENKPKDDEERLKVKARRAEMILYMAMVIFILLPFLFLIVRKLLK